MTTIEYRVCQGPCGRRRQVKFFAGERGRVCVTCKKATSRATARKSHLAKTYEITVAEYDAILAAQGGVCGACSGDRPYNLAVDHDHAIQSLWGVRASVRGLLCKRCNKVLRDVRDSPMLLSQLAAYLNDPPARKVLFA